jgi:hypothetical protein
MEARDALKREMVRWNVVESHACDASVTAVIGGRAADRQTRVAWPALGGDHGQAARGNGWRYGFSERWQRRRRGMRNVGCHRHHVGCAELGWGDTSTHLQSPHGEGARDQRAGGCSHWGDAGVLPGAGHAIPTGVRAACGGHSRHPWWSDGDAGGVWNTESRESAAASDGDGRRISHREPSGRRHRAS